MKKLILLVCFLLISSLSYSQIYVEDFSYSAGSLLTSQPGWAATSGGGTLPITVTGSGLSFPNYIGSGIGNAVLLTVPATASGEDDTCKFFSSRSSGSVYVSFMVNVQIGRTGDYFFALMNEPAAGILNTEFRGRVFTKSVADSGIAFGISKAAGAAEVYTPAVYSDSAVYLLILRYTFVSGATNDEVRLFVYSTTDLVPSSEPALATLGPITAGADLTNNAGKVLLRQGTAASSPTVIVDGIYADSTWNNTLLPVELSSFTSVINNRDVTLNWSTTSEINNSGFDIERLMVNGQWSIVGNVSGNGTTTSPMHYSFTDRNLASGQYNYRLKQIDLNGNFEYFNLSNEVNVGVPVKFDLSQNYPNPFNPSTKINYDLPFDGKVSIKIFDMTGKEVSTIVNEFKTAGYYTADFNAADLGSGVYFYSITTNDFSATKKMLLIK